MATKLLIFRSCEKGLSDSTDPHQNTKTKHIDMNSEKMTSNKKKKRPKS